MPAERHCYTQYSDEKARTQDLETIYTQLSDTQYIQKIIFSVTINVTNLTLCGLVMSYGSIELGQ